MACNDLMWEYGQNAINSLNQAMYWGPPSRFSSYYSDSQYEKYMNESENYKNMTIGLKDMILELKDDYKERKNEINSSNLIGYEVIHKFRCKTKGGLSEIGANFYLVDPNFKTIIFSYDLESDGIQKALEYLESETLETYALQP